MEHVNVQESGAIAEPSQRPYSPGPPVDDKSEAERAKERARTAQAHEIKSGMGAFIAREFIEGKTGPAIIHIENGKITAIKNKPVVDPKIMREISDIETAIPKREKDNQAAQKRVDDFLKSYKYNDAQISGQTLATGERELARLKAALPDRLERFPQRWAGEIAKLANFRAELAAIISEIDEDLKTAEKTGKEFLAAHTTATKSASKQEK